MTALATLTGPLPKFGVVLVAGVAAWVLLASSERTRATAMLVALVLAPVLLLADIWHSPQLSIVHRHPLFAAAGALIGLVAVACVAALVWRYPTLLAVLAVIALPFRVPISAGGTTSNLLVPLYLVVAAGSLAFIVRALRSPASGAQTDRQRIGPIERLLALYIALYGLQSVYSSDFEKALQQMVFFYVPFALLFRLLTTIEWTGAVVRRCLIVVAALAVAFAGIGFVEYATKTIFLNPKLVVANDVHAYFTVNSVFFDPDIFGRFLALVMIALAVGLLYDRPVREQLTATAVLAVLWGGLVLTLSRSSLGALLVGFGVITSLRFNLRKTLYVAAAVIVLGAALVAITPKTFGLNQGANGVSSGRASLVTGGLDLFGDRPIWGWGSGAFVKQYRAHNPHAGVLAASHTIAVTIAAEQGVIGELVYLALVLAAIVALLRGVRSDPARTAIAAAFIALVFHSWLYADFLEDPVTWALLGVGTALGRAAVAAAEPAPRRRVRTTPAVAVGS
jgi:O-antigen ligase